MLDFKKYFDSCAGNVSQKTVQVSDNVELVVVGVVIVVVVVVCVHVWWSNPVVS